MSSKILFVSWSLPPEPTGSAVIVANLAKQFRSSEMIIVGERPNRTRGLVWRDEWPRLVHIALGWPSKWRGGRWWRRLQIPVMLGRAMLVTLKHRCHSIVAVFPNEEYILIGYLTAVLTGSRFYPYFHNTWLENRKGRAQTIARWLQSLVFARADHVFVMSEGMVDLYQERYPKLKCSALVHTFNEQIPAFTPPPSPGPTLRLTICGNINEACRDATLRISEAISRTHHTQLTLLTGSSRSYLAQIGLLRNSVQCETVTRDQVLARLRQADIVVLPHGFTGGYSQEEYLTIFPTRTIEYLICGRPILAHSPPNSFLTRFLKEHECALIVENPSISELVDAIEALRSDELLRAKITQNALRAAKFFDGRLVASHFRARLREA